MPSRAETGGGRWTARLLIAVAVLTGGLLVLGANAHLVHVATSTQPSCVPHLKSMDEATGAFRAAKSAC